MHQRLVTRHSSRRGVEVAGGFTHAYWSLGVGLSLAQRHDEAVAVLCEALALSPSDYHSLATLGWACGRAGLCAEATDIVRQLEERCTGFAGYAVAMVFLGLNDHDQAFHWLSVGYEERGGLMFCLPLWVVWHPLRSDGRYKALLRRMNFPATA